MQTGLRILAAVLVAQLSVMVPAMGATSQGHGVDPVDLICSGQSVSPQARAALGELAEAAGLGSPPEPRDHDDHCPACALAKAADVPESAALQALSALRLVQAAPRPDRASPRQTAGPPVGLRAPPLIV